MEESRLACDKRRELQFGIVQPSRIVRNGNKRIRMVVYALSFIAEVLTGKCGKRVSLW